MVTKKPPAKTVAVERFEVELDLDTADPKGVYPPGATLRGNVVLVNKREIAFHGKRLPTFSPCNFNNPLQFILYLDILVRIKGSVGVGWFDFSRFKQRKAFKTYIDETISLFQNKGNSFLFTVSSD